MSTREKFEKEVFSKLVFVGGTCHVKFSEEKKCYVPTSINGDCAAYEANKMLKIWLAAKAEYQPKWISVEDELPPKNKWVLWLDGDRTMRTELSQYIDLLDSNGECLVNYLHNYTHWMPLPKEQQ